MTKKILALILAGLMLLAALVACGVNEPEDEEISDSDVNAEVSEESESGRSTEDELGAYDFKGMKYKILTREETEYEFDPEVKTGTGGDVVSQAIANRNEAVAKRFNVKFDIEAIEGYFSSQAFINRITNETGAGSTSISLVAGHANRLAQLSVSGNGLDMNELEGVNYEKAWWSEAFYNDCIIDGKTYLMIGDIAYTTYECMEVVFFNQTMIEANNLSDDMYALVLNEDGSMNTGWTYETMKTMAKAIPNATTQEEQDTFGLLLNSHSVKAMLTGMEVEFTQRDENGRHQIKSVLDTYTVTRIDDFVNFMAHNNTVHWDKTTSTDEVFSNAKFAEGKALFYVGELKQITKIANMTDEYGILPTPLKDNLQESYHTGGRDWMTGVMVLKGTLNTEMSGVVTEALCMYGYDYIRPAYYEVAIKGKSTSENAKMIDMLDFIRSNYKMPFGLCYLQLIKNPQDPHPYDSIENCYAKGGNNTITTEYNRYVNSYIDNLRNMYETIDKAAG